MRQDVLIIVDFDGTLWKQNPFLSLFNNEFKRNMKKYNIKIKLQDFIQIQKMLTTNNELRVKGDLKKLIQWYHDTYIYPYAQIKFEDTYNFLINKFNKNVKKLKFRRYAIQTLTELHDDKRFRLIGLTNGYYDYEVKVLNMKLGSYKRILHDYYTPEKILNKFEITPPFKPNTQIINALVKKYNPDSIIVIGDHIRTEGLLSKHSKVTTLLLTPYKKIQTVIQNTPYNKPTPTEVNELNNLWLSGSILFIKSWKKAMNEIKKLTPYS